MSTKQTKVALITELGITQTIRLRKIFSVYKLSISAVLRECIRRGAFTLADDEAIIAFCKDAMRHDTAEKIAERFQEKEEPVMV